MPGAALAAGAAGFFGKLPSRGDFLRVGLPRSFTDPWDAFLGEAIAGSRRLQGETWLEVWLEAPVWHFALPPQMCGPDAALGVWMPSVDRAGRHFPLTLAWLSPDWTRAAEWLGRAEAAGLAALRDDLPPEGLSAQLAQPAAAAELPDLAALQSGFGLWWTQGSPYVPASHIIRASLPDAPAFASMIDARATGET